VLKEKKNMKRRFLPSSSYSERKIRRGGKKPPCRIEREKAKDEEEGFPLLFALKRRKTR
jgi:hypothetical protein